MHTMVEGVLHILDLHLQGMGMKLLSSLSMIGGLPSEHCNLMHNALQKRSYICMPGRTLTRFLTCRP